jgi:hypothetical protein
MRFLVFIVALLGGGFSALVGYIWKDEFEKTKVPLSVVFANIQQSREDAKLGRISESDLERREIATRTIISISRVWPFMFVGLAMGGIAGLLALRRRGWLAAAMMLAAVLGPLALFPDLRTLFGVSGLALGGLLALFVRPLPPDVPFRRTPHGAAAV